MSLFQIIVSVLALALVQARPSPDDSAEHIPILRDDRVHEEGAYSTDVETANGIVMSEAGQPSGPEDAVVAAGSYS